MRERILKMSLEQVIEAFAGIKWKFYETREKAIHVEVPRTERERFVVELAFVTEDETKNAERDLTAAGFILQEIRYTPF